MKHLSECINEENGKAFSRKEKNKTFLLRSNKEIICNIFGIDSCLLSDESINKCDWLFHVPKDKEVNTHLPKSTAYYIELKGGHIHDACEQLFNGIDRTKRHFANCQFEARVISTIGSQPEIKNSTYYRKVKKLIGKDIQFYKVHKGNIFVHVENLIEA